MMVSLGAALMTLVSSYGFLPIVGAAGVSVDVSRVAASIAAGISFLGAGVIFVHRGGVVGLTDGKGDLVRLYDWLEQKKITVREINLKRQEGSSVKIVLYIAMPRHFDKADFLRLQEDIPGDINGIAKPFGRNAGRLLCLFDNKALKYQDLFGIL